MQHKFVEFIPDELEYEILYISIEYKTVAHLCACGCSREVIAPISPTDWKLIYDGTSITLHPSIGNWDFKCRSHYWIKNNNVIWSNQWTDEQIEATKKRDFSNKRTYYNDIEKPIGGSFKENNNVKQSQILKFIYWLFGKQ